MDLGEIFSCAMGAVRGAGVGAAAVGCGGIGGGIMAMVRVVSRRERCQ